MPADLQGINFNAPVGNEDMIFEQRVYRDEFLARIRLVFGDPDYLSLASYGIVAETDPTTVSSASTTEPLIVSASGLTVNVSAGIGVSKNGHRIVLSSGALGKGVTSVEDGATNVVTLKFFTATPDEKVPNEYGVPLYTRRLEPEDFSKVAVYTLSQWNALSADQQDDHVALALATIQTDGEGAKSLSITHSNASYTWLRPWFSALDIAHRKQVGSGTVSATNPHGISFNELSVGRFTLPMLTQHVGQIISQDKTFTNVPGVVCTTSVPSGLIKTDDGAGTVTGEPNAKYVDLGFYPIALGAIHTTGNTAAQWVFRIKPRTSIIYQPKQLNVAEVPASTDLTVLAAKVTTLEPPSGTAVTAFQAGSIQANDAVLSDGKIYTSDMDVTTENTLADAGSIPLRYRLYFSGAKVVASPQVVMCSTLLSEIGSGVQPATTLHAPGYPLVALDKAAAGASLSVKVRLTGLDADGAAVDEVLTFDGTWTESPTPQCSTHAAAFQRASQLFSSITEVSLDENLNAGGTAEIQVWAVLDELSANLAYATPLADTQWDGTKLCTIKDLRLIHHSMQLTDNDDTGAHSAVDHYVQFGQSLGVGKNDSDAYAGGRTESYIVENFSRPIYSSLITPDQTEWSAALGSFMEPDRLWNQYRTQKPGLFGFYESRALALNEQNVQSAVDAILIVFSPTIATERHHGFSSNSMLYAWRTQDSSGTWSAWVSGSSIIQTNKRIRIATGTLSNARAIQVRVAAYNIRSMAIIPSYVSP